MIEKWERQIERERQTERDVIKRERDIRHRDIHIQAMSHRYTESVRDTETYTQRQWVTVTQRATETDRDTHVETWRHKYTESNVQRQESM